MPKALTPTDDVVFTTWIADNWRDAKRQRREAAIICSLMRCSLRAIEVERVNADSVDVDNVLHVPTAKGGIRRLLQLTADHADAIDRTQTVFGRTTKAYQNIALDTLARVLGTTQYSGHSLRHTAAIAAYERTRDIYAVAALLGHRNITSTVCYLRTILETPTTLLPTWHAPRPYDLTTRDAPPFDEVPRDQREARHADKRTIRTAARAAVREYQLQQRKANSVAAALAASLAATDDIPTARHTLHEQVDAAVMKEATRRGATTPTRLALAINVSITTAKTWQRKRDANRRVRNQRNPERANDANEPV